MAHKLFSIVFFIFLCTYSQAFAEVTHFAFVTHPQILLPSTLSQAIIIQAQNSLGAGEAVTETVDLTFTSTSPTGQFLSSSGKTVSKTMAKNTSNRTFYYNDPTLGSYTLTVTAVGRTTKNIFSTTQSISVVSTLPKVIQPISINKATTSKIDPSKQKTKSSSSNTVLTARVIQKEKSTTTPEEKVLYKAPPKSGVFDSIFDLPEKFWKWLKSIF